MSFTASIYPLLAGYQQAANTWQQLALHHHQQLLNHRDHRERRGQQLAALFPLMQPLTLATDWAAYCQDFIQRQWLFWDVLRQRGDIYFQLEEAEAKPILAFEYELISDGRTYKRPVNYALIRILPGADDPAPADHRRPYLIIDPRAGQGAGIGGSKTESQVGIALKAGHPVYFVIFYPQPEPAQTLAEVCRAEAEFVRLIRARHPDAPRPIIVGNCQGGWGAMLLAATHPGLTGPVVLNGAPLSFWAGSQGSHAMRYLGGLVGGTLPALVLSDLGGGRFDGAHLVSNFETFNPAAVWWRKYYDVYSKIDTDRARYLDFERWWSGFYFMNEAEIRWILENLFIGNKLARGQANLDPHTRIDLRQIQSPIIVFASQGDAITPPQQALNWIADTYRDEREIKVRGQRVIYLIHHDVGHLGIFVSSQVAKTHHSQITSTMKTIESLAPGLYEMVIENQEGEGDDAVFTVAFRERRLAEVIASHDDGREDEWIFGTVARLSALLTEGYELTLRPVIQALVTDEWAATLRQLHPLRLRRSLVSSRNPALAALPLLADWATTHRQPTTDDNLFVRLERIGADGIEQRLNQSRDLRNARLELLFHSIYDNPIMRRIGEREIAFWTQTDGFDPQELPEVQQALAHRDDGSYVEAVIRLLILMAKARGTVRRDRLEKSNQLLSHTPPFASVSKIQIRHIIHEQTLIADFGGDAAVTSLARLIPDADQRLAALAIVEDIAGPVAEMTPDTQAMFTRLQQVLGVAPARTAA